MRAGDDHRPRPPGRVGNGGRAGDQRSPAAGGPRRGRPDRRVDPRSAAASRCPRSTAALSAWSWRTRSTATTSSGPPCGRGGSRSSPSSVAVSPRCSGRRWREVPLHRAPRCAAVTSLRIWVFRRRRSRRVRDAGRRHWSTTSPLASPAPSPAAPDPQYSWRALEDSLGDVGIVAAREIKERVRGRIFRVGTLIILVAVAAAIIIPTLHSGGRTTHPDGRSRRRLVAQRPSRSLHTAGSQNQDSVKVVTVPSLAAAKADLRSGTDRFRHRRRRPDPAQPAGQLEQLPGRSRPRRRTWPNTSAC